MRIIKEKISMADSNEDVDVDVDEVDREAPPAGEGPDDEEEDLDAIKDPFERLAREVRGPLLFGLIFSSLLTGAVQLCS